MDERKEQLRDFLTSRRARITPQQAGLPSYGGTARRVPGLRRSELAMLAGISVEWLTKLERGNATGVSDSVLAALARALQLDEAETAHLVDLTHGARDATGAPRRPARRPVRPGVQQLLDAMTEVPAFIQDGRLDVLASNAVARALYSDLMGSSVPSTGRGAAPLPNHARYTFLDPRAADFYPDWNRAAADTVALLRAEAGRDPDDRVLNELVGELTTRSERFSALWAAHNVRWHTTGTKRFRHAMVGEMTLAYEGLELTGEAGQTLVTFTAEPGSPSNEALAFLVRWASGSKPATEPQDEQLRH